MSILDFGPKLMDLKPFLERKYAVQEQEAAARTSDARTNRINSATTRFAAQTDRQRLPIEQFAANTNRMNARTNRFNARTSRMDTTSLIPGRQADARLTTARAKQEEDFARALGNDLLARVISGQFGGQTPAPEQSAQEELARRRLTFGF